MNKLKSGTKSTGTIPVKYYTLATGIMVALSTSTFGFIGFLPALKEDKKISMAVWIVYILAGIALGIGYTMVAKNCEKNLRKGKTR
ncbi:MAG: hypothetical protein LBF28_02825 [Rickettsiales bacterium]|jgi:uncharacterized membrane protein|nr:hypothetical protein [Rickettsiales bacterium]